MNAAQLWNDHTFRVLLEDLFKARKDEALGPLRLEAIFRYVEGAQPVPTNRPGSQPPPPKKLLSDPVFIPSFKVVDPVVAGHDAEPVDGPGGAFEGPGNEGPAGFLIEHEEGVQEREDHCYKCKAKRKLVKRGNVWRCDTCGSSNVNSIPTPQDQDPAKLESYAEQAAKKRQGGMEALNAAADLLEKAILDPNGWDSGGNKQVGLPKGTLVAGLEKMLHERGLAFTAISFSMPPKQQSIPNSVKGMSLEAADRISGSQGSQAVGIVAVVAR